MSTAESVFRTPDVEQRLDASNPSSDFSAGEYRARAAEALSLWLRWNTVYENVTTAMFEQRLSQAQLQQSMDLADQLRQMAVELTQALVGCPKE